MAYSITSIPQIFRAILVLFLASLMLYITYPISNYILAMFDPGIMKVTAFFIFYFIVVTVFWVFVWLPILQPDQPNPITSVRQQ